MPTSQETYKGKTIIISEERGESNLYIDGEHVHVIRPKPGGLYHTPYFFQGHATLGDLAKALIERVPRFAPKSTM